MLTRLVRTALALGLVLVPSGASTELRRVQINVTGLD